jgi:hypothetical protein
MAVNDATLNTDIFNEIRTILVASNIVTTNSTTSATTAVPIGAVFNEENIANQRPQIVISPANVSEDSWKFSSFEGKKLINVMVDCYASNTLALDQMSDQVSVALKENLITGVDLVGITSDYAFDEINNNKYHLRAFLFSYDRE